MPTQEESREEKPWLFKCSLSFNVNNQILLPRDESKAYTREIFLRDLADKVGEGKCIVRIYMQRMECDSYSFPYLWTALSNNIIDTGLKVLTLTEMRGGVKGGDVMAMLDSSSIDSLTSLNLSENPNWWTTSDDSFSQLLTFVGRQTHLKEFFFDANALTTNQTTQLLQCIA